MSASRRALWREIRPLEEGATASWMRLFYEHLYKISFVADSVDEVAQIAIDHAHATFRAELVAIALLDGDAWNVLPFRQNGARAAPLRIALAQGDDDPGYEPGQIVEIPDLDAFADAYPRMRPLAARGVRAVVVAAFGSHVHGRGYLAFASRTPQHYSDDEYTLMCLHALTAGIGLDRVGRAAH